MARRRNKEKQKLPHTKTVNNSLEEKTIDGSNQEQKNKIDVALITDERIAAKIVELDKQIEKSQVELQIKKNELEKEYKEKEQDLQHKIEEQQLEIDIRVEELDKQKEVQEKKEKELVDIEAQVKKQCEVAIIEEINKIKADERRIREKEKEAIYYEWEADKAKQKAELDEYVESERKKTYKWKSDRERQKAELEEYITSQRKKVDDELEKAHNERMTAEEEKLSKIHEADAIIEEQRAVLTEEYSQKIAELSKKKKEYEHKLQKLEEQQADLDEDTEYVNSLKEKYNKYSEKEVIKLQQEVEHYKIQIECCNERIKELSDKNAHIESTLLDNDGHSLAVRINELEAQLEEAIRRNDELANMPSEEEIERLRANTQELETMRVALDDEKQKRHEAEAKISAYAMSTRELENARVSAAALESLNNQLQMKLKYISEQYRTTQESKFKVLLNIDEEIASQGIYNPKGFNGTLLELCEYIRNFGAYNKGLYYSIDTIRVFFASLAASKKASRLLILQGLSGTGKSSLPRLVAEALDAECKIVPVQPSWRDNRELLGYDNDFTNKFKETEFTKFLYEASAGPNRQKIFFIVLDEMNLARIEYYFADFLSVLEKTNNEEWIVPLVSGYSEMDEDQKPKYLNYSNEAANICITSNIWFVGTANNDDSTSLITDKVYDRAQVLDMDKREDEFNGKRVSKVAMSLDELLTLFEEAKTTANKLKEDDRDKIKLVDEYLKDMDITFGNRIMNQMDDFVPVYIACGGTKEEAIDYILTHKILRKLDERYEPYLITKLDELESGLNEIYGEDVFKQSIDKIHRLREKIAG